MWSNGNKARHDSNHCRASLLLLSQAPGMAPAATRRAQRVASCTEAAESPEIRTLAFVPARIS